MAATPRVELNLDILKHNLSLVDRRSDLLALMRSCHALYAAGIQPLVRLPIVITDQHIRSNVCVGSVFIHYFIDNL